ncbi:MAG: hypothetical protein AAGA53_15995 [Pseudomonadota bacterium]
MYKPLGKAGLLAVFAFSLSIGVVASPKEGQSQSFSCANAQIPSEMAICNNENLLVKDETLAALFAEALVEANGTQSTQNISAEHSRWLKERNDCRADFECLENSYDARIDLLKKRSL